MHFSRFGQKLTHKTGILALMDDLGNALSGDRKVHMLGGGNPAHIPAVQQVFRARMQEIMHSGNGLEQMLGNYDTPQGNLAFVRTLAEFLNREYGWGISEHNIAITNGSQTAFFYLFNLLAGEMADGSFKKILFPLTPEYIGYADQGISDGMFTSIRPEIERLDDHLFKYHVDFDRLEVGDDIAAICVSRPTNPTGNVLTDEEVAHLSRIAEEKGIPLIVDNAYGVPFPGIVFTDAKPTWNENIILGMSLSKLGLPSSRTGILIAREEIVEAMASINAIASLASGGIGQTLLEPMIASGMIKRLGDDMIRPYYLAKAEQAQIWVRELFDDALPYHVHKCEGALFLWMWFEGLPITSLELYERLKRRGVVVVPGEYFFPGLADDWTHKSECLRINYTQSEADVYAGLKIIAEEVRNAYHR